MGKRGPAKKPTKLKILQGNPGKKPLNENEPMPQEFEEIPEPPWWMDYYGKKEWEARAPYLIETGLLTHADLATFTVMCQTYARFVRAEKELMEDGLVDITSNGNKQSSPLEFIARKASEQYKQYCRELGLSPASRANIEVEKPDSTPSVEDLLSGKSG